MLTSFLMDARVWRRLVWSFERDILILGVVGEVVEVGLELLLGCKKVGSWVEWMVCVLLVRDVSMGGG
jgi:hypothetical protein